MSQKYNFEAIWRRIYRRINLKTLSRARTDKQRFKLFEKAFDKEKELKNLKKLKKSDFKKLYHFGIAQQERDLDKRIKKIEKKKTLSSVDRRTLTQKENFDRIKKRLKDSSIRSISVKKMAISGADEIDIAIRKVELKKRIRIKTIPEQPKRGRKITVKRISTGFTVKRFISRKTHYVGFWKKGRKGFFAVVKE